MSGQGGFPRLSLDDLSPLERLPWGHSKAVILSSQKGCGGTFVQLRHRLAGPWGHSKASILRTQNGCGGAFVQLRHRLARHLFAGAGSLGSLKNEHSVITEQVRRCVCAAEAQVGKRADG